MIMRIKKYRKLLFIIGLIILLILFFNSRLVMLNLPEGDYIESLDSPTGDYTLKSYKYSGGATMDWTLRVELIDNKNNNKTNIYWVYHENIANMRWIDKENVEINGIKLNVFKDYYRK